MSDAHKARIVPSMRLPPSKAGLRKVSCRCCPDGHTALGRFNRSPKLWKHGFRFHILGSHPGFRIGSKYGLVLCSSSLVWMGLEV